jgi:hypothetical protein
MIVEGTNDRCPHCGKPVLVGGAYRDGVWLGMMLGLGIGVLVGLIWL